MAQRRMFSKKIVETDLFMEMSPTAKILYFYLNMSADDDGFVGNPKTIKLISGATDDDLKILIAKQFIIPFDSGVIVIKDWKIHNYIQKDRYNQTQYLDEKKQLLIEENGTYTKCIQNVSSLDTQVRLGKSKDRSGEVRTEKERIDKDTNSLLSVYFETFTKLAMKNNKLREAVKIEFVKLSDSQKEQAVIGAKNYYQWYKREKSDDSTGKFSVNAINFINGNKETFDDFQVLPQPSAQPRLGGYI
ncbi:phage replisome organizer protein [Lactococcus lactis subsp. lactis]|uniref:Putative replisome organiser C-terminal domain-containing protein n=1 Tax=Lactococcus lactis subsp. lactis TaxID=1360 RepID=A0AAC9W856_LACLL|nr:phage replisome organiser protein [Lactococcus lactis]ARE12724.1 phage replisome organizer protein [Lactococcus lactis subsp. lactis]ARE15133.1 phage replisome organizer protein [Lactococcus lactis subsp. lactis]